VQSERRSLRDRFDNSNGQRQPAGEADNVCSPQRNDVEALEGRHREEKTRPAESMGFISSGDYVAHICGLKGSLLQQEL